MFLGHFAVGLALKRVTPRTSLGVLVAAPQALDLLWPWFLLAGWEHVRIDPGNTAFTPLAFESYPWSHSLVMALVWGCVFAGAYRLFTRRTGTGNGRASQAAAWLIVAVVSHWLLDWISHAPDMPLAPWTTARFGLGLWNSRVATMVIEALLFAGALWVYAGATPTTSRAGRIHLGLFASALVVIYVANAFGPPPPDERSLAFVAASLLIVVPWAVWVDRSRARR